MQEKLLLLKLLLLTKLSKNIESKAVLLKLLVLGVQGVVESCEKVVLQVVRLKGAKLEVVLLQALLPENAFVQDLLFNAPLLKDEVVKGLL